MFININKINEERILKKKTISMLKQYYLFIDSIPFFFSFFIIFLR